MLKESRRAADDFRKKLERGVSLIMIEGRLRKRLAHVSGGRMGIQGEMTCSSEFLERTQAVSRLSEEHRADCGKRVANSTL